MTRTRRSPISSASSTDAPNSTDDPTFAVITGEGEAARERFSITGTHLTARTCDASRTIMRLKVGILTKTLAQAGETGGRSRLSPNANAPRIGPLFDSRFSCGGCGGRLREAHRDDDGARRRMHEGGDAVPVRGREDRALHCERDGLRRGAGLPHVYVAPLRRGPPPVGFGARDVARGESSRSLTRRRARCPVYFGMLGGGSPASTGGATVSGRTQDERSKSMNSSAFSCGVSGWETQPPGGGPVSGVM